MCEEFVLESNLLLFLIRATLVFVWVCWGLVRCGRPVGPVMDLVGGPCFCLVVFTLDEFGEVCLAPISERR